MVKNIHDSIYDLVNYKKNYEKTVSDGLFSVFSSFFEKHNNVNIIHWPQYAGYQWKINDPNEFCIRNEVGFAYIPNIDYNNIEQYFNDYELRDDIDGVLRYWDFENLPCFEDINVIDFAINDGDCLELWKVLGEGLIVVTKNGFQVLEISILD